jgi:hypothetical protein
MEEIAKAASNEGLSYKQRIKKVMAVVRNQETKRKEKKVND